MEPLKPKFSNTIKLEIRITDVSKETLSQYSKYTKFTEGEIIDYLISGIPKFDPEFVDWLKKRRFKKKAESKILSQVNRNPDEEHDLRSE